MQGQKRCVNDYVVIIFDHYIKCFGDGRMRKNVTWASLLEWRVASVASPFCGEPACPALGCEAPPIQQNAVCLIRLSAWFWGCCAAQRRTSLLATGNLRLTERHWDNACSPQGIFGGCFC